MVKDALNEAEERMKGAIQSLENDLARIRTGRASPKLVEHLLIEYYGAPTPLIQLANISVPEPRSILIRPFDAGSLRDIERAILSSDLGINPNNDGKNIHLNLPPLTEERRIDLVKMVNKRTEDARVAIRNVRRDSIRDLVDFEKEKMISENELARGKDEMDELTKKYIDLAGESSKRKEKEVMEI